MISTEESLAADHGRNELNAFRARICGGPAGKWAIERWHIAVVGIICAIVVC